MNRQLKADDGPLVGMLQSTATGDRAAFRSLYEATAPKLFGVVLRIVRNRQVAEEVLQETYIRVWRSAVRFAPEAGRPIAWLTTIARNCAIDRIRSDKVDQARTDDGEVLERLAAPDSGDPVLREALTRCLDGLEEEARNCVVMAYCSGYSREELAQRFGRPVGTIKTLLHRSVKLLKACLEQE